MTFLIRAVACGEEACPRAMLRLVQIAFAGRLTEEEEKDLGKAIWGAGTREDGGIPGAANLRHWVYFQLPQPNPGVAEEWFREKWLTSIEPSRMDGEFLDNSLFHIGDAKEKLSRHGLSLDFSEEDRDYLAAPTDSVGRDATPASLAPWMGSGSD